MKKLLLLTVVMLASVLTAMAQVTTSSINGKVVADGEEVIGATVTAKHLPSGTTYNAVTNIHGEVNREGVRKMTPREWARLQGFPDEFKIVVADASAYKQFGNSVAIPAIKATAKNELKLLGVI